MTLVSQVSSNVHLPDVVHVRCNRGRYAVGTALTSTVDWGVRGHVFYEYEGGAWVQMVKGASEHVSIEDEIDHLGPEEALSVRVGDSLQGFTVDQTNSILPKVMIFFTEDTNYTVVEVTFGAHGDCMVVTWWLPCRCRCLPSAQTRNGLGSSAVGGASGARRRRTASSHRLGQLAADIRDL